MPLQQKLLSSNFLNDLVGPSDSAVNIGLLNMVLLEEAADLDNMGLTDNFGTMSLNGCLELLDSFCTVALGDYEESNVLCASGREVCAEVHDLLINACAVGFNADEEQLFALGRICGGNLVTGGLVGTCDLLCDVLSVAGLREEQASHLEKHM